MNGSDWRESFGDLDREHDDAGETWLGEQVRLMDLEEGRGL